MPDQITNEERALIAAFPPERVRRIGPGQTGLSVSFVWRPAFGGAHGRLVSTAPTDKRDAQRLRRAGAARQRSGK